MDAWESLDDLPLRLVIVGANGATHLWVGTGPA